MVLDPSCRRQPLQSKISIAPRKPTASRRVGPTGLLCRLRQLVFFASCATRSTRSCRNHGLLDRKLLCRVDLVAVSDSVMLQAPRLERGCRYNPCNLAKGHRALATRGGRKRVPSVGLGSLVGRSWLLRWVSTCQDAQLEELLIRETCNADCSKR
jgi:hypothetical protein